jgi:predicted TIM-barrel fold metal-dependent hydrolase
MTDIHVHLAALPTACNGCVLSKRMRGSLLLSWVARWQGLSLSDPDATNRRYVELLAEELSRSTQVKQAVLLAMDGVYDSTGELDESRTDFLISNDYLFEVASAHQRLLPGASINPARKDSLDELDRCSEKGAVLVKVLPNAQGFDPAERRFGAFYKRLAELRMPLLSHTGYEFSLFAQDQSLGDPARLVPVLEEGVTVIAAHGCGSGLFVAGKYFDTMLRLMQRYPNFYVDSSALTLPVRVGTLFKMRRHPEIHQRLLFGTDYPLPCLSYPCLGAFAFDKFIESRRTTNRFDRQVHVLNALGISAGADAMRLLRRME